MPKFQYTARNLSGGKVAGLIEADAAGAAIQLLERRELYPIDIWNTEDKGNNKSFRGRISNRDLSVMYGQLSDLLGSGVPLLRALKSIRSPQLINVLQVCWVIFTTQWRTASRSTNRWLSTIIFFQSFIP